MIPQQYDWIQQKKYIDAKDKHNEWQVGYVLAKTKTNVKLRYDGWPSAKFDQIFPINSPKLRPFRSVIKGYTGQRKSPGVREHWQFSIENLQQRLSNFLDFTTHINEKSAYEINQLLRGQHYFFMDFMFSIAHPDIISIRKMFTYLKAHLQFVRNYLIQLVQKDINLWFSAGYKQQNKQKIAYSQIYYQIFDAIYAILAQQLRLASFFKNNQRLLRELISPEINYQIYMTKQLNSINFIQALQSLVVKMAQQAKMAQQQKIVQQVLMIQQIKSNIKQIPLQFINQLYRLYATLNHLPFNKQLRKKIGINFVLVFQHLLTRFSPNDIKINQKAIDDLFGVMKFVFSKSFDRQLLRWMQTAKLKVWRKLILTDVLQKKLRGISKIKQFFDLLTHPSAQVVKTLLSKQQFREWVSCQNLIQIIFKSNQHSQIIKKGCQLIQSFYASQLFGIQKTIYIWEICFQKHQAIKKIVCQFWIDLIQYVQKHQWKIFFDILINNIHNFNQDWELQFLFNFLRSVKDNKIDPFYVRILVDQLYKKTLQNNRFLNHFVQEICLFDNNDEIFKQTIDKCLIKIQTKQMSLFHLEMMNKMFHQLYQQKIYIPQKLVSVLLSELKTIINVTDNGQFVLLILQLLNQIMGAKQNKICLQFSDFQQLWKIFTQCEKPAMKKIFFSWLITKNSNNQHIHTYQINVKLYPQLKQFIFQRILCDKRTLDFTNMTVNQFVIFREFLLFINHKNHNIQIKTCSFSGKRIMKVKSQQIIGMTQLWGIFKNCQSDQVINGLCTFLKNIFLKSSALMAEQQKVDRILSLLERLNLYIKDGCRRNNIKTVRHSLVLLTKVISQIKQKIQIPKQYQKAVKQSKVTIKAMDQDSRLLQLQVFVQQCFITVKQQIANKFHLHKQQFSLYANRQQIPIECYDLPLYLLRMDDYLLRIVKNDIQLNKIVLKFIEDKLYPTFIQLLTNQQLAFQTFSILQLLQVRKPIQLYHLLSQQIAQIKDIQAKQKKIYFHIFYLRVYNLVLEKDYDLIERTIEQKLISHLSLSIESNLSVIYLQKLVQVLNNSTRHRQQKMPLSIQQNQVNGCHYQKNLVNGCHYQKQTYNLLLRLIKYFNSSSPRLISNNQWKLINNATALYVSAFPSKIQLIHQLVNSQNFQEFIIDIFFKPGYQRIKSFFQKKINSWLKEGFKNQHDQLKMATLLAKKMYLAIGNHNHFSIEISSFFKVLKTVFETISQGVFVQILKQIQQKLKMPLLDYVMKQISKQSDLCSITNYYLNGQLQMLSILCKRSHQSIHPQLIQYLLFSCLVFQKSRTSSQDVKCLSSQNISIVLQLLFNIIISMRPIKLVQNQQILQNKVFNQIMVQQSSLSIFSQFYLFHLDDFWRNQHQWNLDFQQLAKIKAPFIGLQNPGCICYLNSLLQQLFMIEQFRYNILCIPQKSITMQQQVQDSPQMIQKLKMLFLNLMFSQRSAIDPQFFTSSIQNGGKPMVKIFQQMDIDQFSMILFDKIQNKLNCLKFPNFIRNLFGGHYSNQIISLECKHSSERQEQFLSISLDVKKNIAQSFQSLVKGQTLQGQNSYYCDTCDKKVKALKRLSLKKLPPHLIISLRRFEFDYEIDSKIKINKYCQFPFQLNLQPYSQNKLNLQQNRLNLQQKKINLQQKNHNTMQVQSGQDEQKGQKNIYPPEYYVYKLKGVVIHEGSADSGHYYSLIQGDQQRWFQFNDEKISDFNLKYLPDQAFGGKDREYNKIKNAYLLFYQRKDKTDFHNPAQKLSASEQSMNMQSHQVTQIQQKSQVSIPSKQWAIQMKQNLLFIQQIKQQNKKLRLFRFLFSRQYFNFMMNLRDHILPCLNICVAQNQNLCNDYQKLYPVALNSVQYRKIDRQKNHRLVSQFFKFFSTYVLLIALRHKSILVAIDLVNSLSKILVHKDNTALLQLFIQAIADQTFIQQILIDSIARQKTRAIAKFIFQMITVYLINKSKQSKQNTEQKQLPCNILRFLTIAFKNIILNATNIIKLLTSKRLQNLASKPKQPILQFLLQNNLINILMDNALNARVTKQDRQKKLQLFQKSTRKAETQKTAKKTETQKTTNALEAQKGQLAEEVGSDLSADDETNLIGDQTKPTALVNPLFSSYTISYLSISPCRTTQSQTWYLLSILYPIIKQQKKEQLNENKTEYFIKHEAQINLFFHSVSRLKEDKLSKFVNEAKDTKSILILANYLCILATNDIKITQNIISTAENSFKDLQSSKYRAYLLILQKLILIDDTIQKQRLIKIITMINKSLTINDKFFLQSDFLQQWLLRYASLSTKFLQVLYDYPSIGANIRIWLIQKHSPIAQTLKKHRIAGCERLSQRLHGIFVSGQSSQYQKNMLWKSQQFQRIKNNKFTPISKYRQQAQITQTYQVGNIIQYFYQHYGYWMEGQVIANTFGLLTINLVYNKKIQKNWLWEDDEKIRLKKIPQTNTNSNIISIDK